jgi:hypothetical protein
METLREQRAAARARVDRYAPGWFRAFVLERFKRDLAREIHSSLPQRAIPTEFSLQNADSPSVASHDVFLGRYSSRCTFQKKTTKYIVHCNVFEALKCFDAESKFLRLFGQHVLGDGTIVRRGLAIVIGRGTSISLARQTELRLGNTRYHAESGQSLRKAHAALGRKIRAEQLLSALPTGFAPSADAIGALRAVVQAILAGQVTAFDALRVRRDDGVAAQNCKPGTREFIAANELDHNNSVTIAEYRMLNRLNYKREVETTLAAALKRHYGDGKIQLDEIRNLVTEYMQ